MRACPTSLAFRLGAHVYGVNVVMSNQSYIASSNKTMMCCHPMMAQPSEYTEALEGAAHRLSMHHITDCLDPTDLASLPSLAGSLQGGPRIYDQPLSFATIFGGVRARGVQNGVNPPRPHTRHPGGRASSLVGIGLVE